MKLSNKTYDLLKWIAIVLIPAVQILILHLGDIWSFANYVQIAKTIAEIGVFLAAILGVSSYTYYKKIGETEAVEVEEDADPEQEA